MRKYILHISLVLLSLTSYSQDFKGGFLVGATTSQVNGDKAGGFHKLGSTFGGFVQKEISDKYIAGFEMRFTQKGSRSNNANLKISLAYIEVPVIISYKLNNELRLKAGGSVSVNIFETNIVGDFATKTSNFKGLDFPFIVGAEYMLKPHIGLDVRSAFSIVPVNHIYTNWCLYATAHVYILQ